MTIDEIQTELAKHRPLSRRQVQRHMKAAGIKPAGARQRPQIYQRGALGILLTHLGLDQPAEPAAARLVSTRELQRESRRA